MKITKIFIWPDTHTPFHNRRAVSCAKRLLVRYAPDYLIFLGDYFDCYLANSFGVDPLKTAGQISQELQAGIVLLNDIIKVSKAKQVIFLEGNHERRIRREVKKRLPYFADYFDINAPLGPKKILGIPDKVQFIKYGQKQRFTLGPLSFRHKTFQNQHVCNKTIQRSVSTFIFGHTHRVQYTVTTTLEGITQAAYSAGWMGDAELAGEYMDTTPEWGQCVTTIDLYKDYFNINPFLIKNGKLIANGKWF